MKKQYDPDVLLDALERLYEPICDIHFISKMNILHDPMAIEMFHDAVKEFSNIAKSNEWFIDKFKEEE